MARYSYVYEALVCDDPESGMLTISIHRTEMGARNALAKWLRTARKDIFERRAWSAENGFEPDDMKSDYYFINTHVVKTKILP
jgi:hypothetical protein